MEIQSDVHRYFSPNGDGQEDVVQARLCLSSAANVTVRVVDPRGQTVRTLADDVSRPAGCDGSSQDWLAWDGSGDGGRSAPDGVYRFLASAIATNGDTGEQSVEVGVDRRSPGWITAPAPGATVSGTLDWAFASSPGFVDGGVRASCDGADLGSSGPGDGGIYRGSGDTAGCRAGENLVRATFSWVDPFDVTHYWTAPDVSVKVDNAPVVSGLDSYAHRYFSPDGDDQEDDLYVPYCLSKPAVVTVTVSDRAGAVRRTLLKDESRSGSYCGGNNNWMTWDGKDDAGEVVPDGIYRISVRAVDASGHDGEQEVETGVSTRAPGALVAPTPGTRVAGTLEWGVRPAADVNVSWAQVSCEGAGLGLSSDLVDGVLRGSGDTGACRPGANRLTAVLNYADPFGVSHYWSAPAVTVVIDNPPVVSQLDYSGRRYFSPNGDEQEGSLALAYCLDKTAAVTTTVTDQAGAVVRILESAVPHEGASCIPYRPDHELTWDGKDDAGKALPDGVYRVAVRAVDGSGQVGRQEVETGIDRRKPGVLTGPVAGQTISDSVTWTFTPTEGIPVTQVYVECRSASLTTDYEPGDDGRFTATAETGGCTQGDNEITAVAYWTDVFGGSHSWRSPGVSVRIANEFALELLVPEGQDQAFSPGTDGNEDTTSTRFCLTKDADLTVTVVDETNRVVRTLEDAVPHQRIEDCRYRNEWIEWDGKDDAGKVVPDGVYTLRFRAVDTKGTVKEAATRRGVDTRSAGALTTPAPGDTLAGLARIVFRPATGFPVEQVNVAFDSGGSTPVYSASPDGSWRTSIYTGSLRSGPTVARPYVSYRDTFGVTHTWHGPPVPVTIDVTSLPLTVDVEPASGPAPLRSVLRIATSDPAAGTVHYAVEFGDGSRTSGDLAAPYEPVQLAHDYRDPGAYRAIVTVTNDAGAATSKAVDVTVRGAGNSAPTAELKLDASSGKAPLPVVATVRGADAEQDRLRYQLDFGDGSAAVDGQLPVEPIAHTYSRAGTYVARLAVSDGRQTTVRTTRVIVALAEPLAAAAGDDQAVVTGTTVHLDGTASKPSVGINSYYWDLGDGTTVQGAALDHVYAEAGAYDAVLSVTADGQTRTDTARITVSPPPREPGLGIKVTDGGSPVEGASLVVVDADGKRTSAATGQDGTARLTGLADGAYTVYGWKQSYLPATLAATVQDGSGSAELRLTTGRLATSELTSEPMTLEEIEEAGIDTSDPTNQHVYEFEIHLGFSGVESTVSGYTSGGGGSGGGSGGGFSGGFPLCPEVDGTEIACGGGTATFEVQDYTVSVTTQYVDSQPQLLWLVIPGKASWLKEFFNVQMMVTNLADPAFVLQNGSTTLTLPKGLSLAPTASPQALNTSLPDIPGGESATASWAVRGDTEGEYPLRAGYAGTLAPFDTPISIEAESSHPLKVWGGSAVSMTVDAEEQVYDRYPYRVRIGLTNEADVPVYNAAVELLTKGKVNYIYQPREALQQGVAEIEPGKTFWTDDYVLAPEISGVLDLEHSFVKKTAGDVDLATKIISHASDSGPGASPRFAAAGLKDSVGFTWDEVSGATSYEIYRTPDREHDFPAEPLVVVPAGQTRAVVPAKAGESNWYAVSSIVNGRHTMFHPIVEGIGSDLVTDPNVSVRLTSTASCGQPISGSMQFASTFHELTGFRAFLDGRRLDVPGEVRGREQTVALPTIPAADIKEGGSTLEVWTTDTATPAGQHGPVWKGTLSTACNPIKMLVLGDSIAWGQGLLDHEKFPALVAQGLTRETKRPVEFQSADDSLAHSGAVVEKAGCSPDLRKKYGDIGGEIPSGSPDIGTCQVEASTKADADIILVDGCINDIGAQGIVLDDSVDIPSKVKEHCDEPVENMLTSLHRRHPAAQIVYTGYYKIVDIALPSADLLKFAAIQGMKASALRGILGLPLSAQIPENLVTTFPKDRSEAFVKEFTKTATQVQTRIEGRDPSASRWLHLADPAFRPASGLFAPFGNLYTLPDDPLVVLRTDKCFDEKGPGWHIFDGAKWFDAGTCSAAAVGHPNPAGARAYSDAVMKALDSWIDSTRDHNISGLRVGGPQGAFGGRLNLAVGDQQSLVITAIRPDGTSGDPGPSLRIRNDTSPGGAGVLRVDEKARTVAALKAGRATLRFQVDGLQKAVELPISVSDRVPRELTIVPASPIVAVGQSLSLQVMAAMSDGTTTDVTSQVQWSTNRPGVVQIAGGTVTGRAEGAAGVTARLSRPGAEAPRATTQVTVTAGAPRITGFSPPSGRPGARVTIRGSGLLGATEVTFSGVTATFDVVSSTSITAVVPAGAATGQVGIRTPLGNVMSRNSFRVSRA